LSQPSDAANSQEEVLERKMPRTLRLHAPGAFYHVTLRITGRISSSSPPIDSFFNELTYEVITRFTARLSPEDSIK